MRNKIAVICMVLGVGILLTPIIGKWYTKYEQQKLYREFEQKQENLKSQMNILNDTWKSSLGDEMLEENLEEEMLPEEGMIGTITIPVIDITLPIVEGVGNAELKYAAGHMPQTAWPGEVGNCVIAAHRSYTFGEYFNQLDKVAIGDYIEVTRGTKTYIYKVTETFLVEPTDTSVAAQGEETMITLITCHPVINATHRLIVKGLLEEVR